MLLEFLSHKGIHRFGGFIWKLRLQASGLHELLTHENKGFAESAAVEEFCALDLFLDAKEAKLAVKGKAGRDWQIGRD